MVDSPIANHTSAQMAATFSSANQPANFSVANQSFAHRDGNPTTANELSARGNNTSYVHQPPSEILGVSQSSGQTKVNPTVVNNTDRTSTSLPSVAVVTDERSWQTPSTMTSEPTASATTVPFTSPLANPLPVNVSSNTVPVAPANSSRQTHADIAHTGSASQSQNNASTETHNVTPRQTAHSPAVAVKSNTPIAAYIPPSDQSVNDASILSSGQQTVNLSGDKAFTNYMQSEDVSASTTVESMPQQGVAPQVTAESAQQYSEVVNHGAHNTKPENQPNSVPSIKGNGDLANESPARSSTVSDWTPQAGAGAITPIVGDNVAAATNLPEHIALPGNGDRTQSTGNSSVKNNSAAPGAKKSGSDVAPDTTNSKSIDAGGTASDGSLHAAQRNGQQVQHSQTDTVQGTGASVKGAEGSASQLQTAVTHPAPGESATTLRGAGATQNTSPQTPQRSDPATNDLDGGQAPGTSGINAAKLIHSLGETGMNVAMRSSEFGDISIRTSVSPQQMLTQISLDHSDLSQVLSSHVSSTQTKLEHDYGLRSVIEVNHQGASSSGDSGNSAPREQKDFIRTAPIVHAATAVESDTDIGSGSPMSAGNGIRLDIRA